MLVGLLLWLVIREGIANFTIDYLVIKTELVFERGLGAWGKNHCPFSLALPRSRLNLLTRVRTELMDLLYTNIFSPLSGLKPSVSSLITKNSQHLLIVMVIGIPVRICSDRQDNAFRLAGPVPSFISSIQNISSFAGGISLINICSEELFLGSVTSTSSSIPNTTSLFPILLMNFNRYPV